MLCRPARTEQPPTPVHIMCAPSHPTLLQHLATLVVSQLRLRHLPAALYLLLAITFAATGFFCEAAHEVRCC